MMVFDASVLIATLSEGDTHRDRIDELLSGSEGEAWGASTVTLAEVLVHPAAERRENDAWHVLADMGMREVALPDDAALRLARLRVATRLKLPDCCVLLAAETTGARGVLTFDDRLRDAARAAGFDAP